MRLDHISYVASHDQISDVVNRIGSQIGTAFIVAEYILNLVQEISLRHY